MATFAVLAVNVEPSAKMYLVFATFMLTLPAMVWAPVSPRQSIVPPVAGKSPIALLIFTSAVAPVWTSQRIGPAA
jgi:hypothetical protein